MIDRAESLDRLTYVISMVILVSLTCPSLFMKFCFTYCNKSRNLIGEFAVVDKSPHNAACVNVSRNQIARELYAMLALSFFTILVTL